MTSAQNIPLPDTINAIQKIVKSLGSLCSGISFYGPMMHDTVPGKTHGLDKRQLRRVRRVFGKFVKKHPSVHKQIYEVEIRSRSLGKRWEFWEFILLNSSQKPHMSVTVSITGEFLPVAQPITDYFKDVTMGALRSNAVEQHYNLINYKRV